MVTTYIVRCIMGKLHAKDVCKKKKKSMCNYHSHPCPSISRVEILSVEPKFQAVELDLIKFLLNT